MCACVWDSSTHWMRACVCVCVCVLVESEELFSHSSTETHQGLAPRVVEVLRVGPGRSLGVAAVHTESHQLSGASGALLPRSTTFSRSPMVNLRRFGWEH